MHTARTVIKSNGGFTLIEIMVVVILISMFAVFSVPRLTDFGQMEVDKDARKLANTIGYLHTQAMASKQLYRLEIDAGTGEYHLSFLNSEGEFVEGVVAMFKKGKLSSGVKLIRFTSLFNGELAGDTATIHFLPEGFAEKAVIVLGDEKGEHKVSLIVNPLTGAVQVLKGEKEFSYSPLDAFLHFCGRRAA